MNGRYMYILPPDNADKLFARTSDHIRIKRSKARNDKGQNRYTVIIPKQADQEFITVEFKFMERFFQWFENEIGSFRIVHKRRAKVDTGNLSDALKCRILDLRRDGLTYKRISTLTNRSESTIAQLCRKWEKENGEKLNKRAA